MVRGSSTPRRGHLLPDSGGRQRPESHGGVPGPSIRGRLHKAQLLLAALASQRGRPPPPGPGWLLPHGQWAGSRSWSGPSPVRPGRNGARAPTLGIIHWTEDGRYLYATRAAKDKWERGLVRYDLNRRQEEILVLDSDIYRSWNIAEDGSRIVFRRSDGDRPDEIWTASGDFGNARPSQT